ncbi:MAG: 3-(cis-5,6-dihydroxycyclohexa-1,3-dien-1-yl)propanoate dehydrogenase [Rhodococcus sp. (in: high G+C Gram-positive bacteria)]|uniref:3-(cis-5,6-dihydroxycyclohexa-1, 3-dien-1-yl)propanoate dehydrogenase n=1 Tax=Rhodococcus sp. TaxID=1831 RepID=UPI002ADB7FDA|nr:3-(cis-5,6-dihydroxycyclohexa-1,3-dien-1-yl)propanoate dehydrogenase [Rhodococcus sp. (in: high G+C Gram-positive bacteria)]
MDFLHGKTVLVTGGGSGIGRAVVDLFLAEGAKVGVLEISPSRVEELRNAYPTTSLVVTEGDAASFDDNRRAVDAVVEAFGRLTTLVCVAGVYDYNAALPDIDESALGDAFDQIFSVNVKSMLFAIRAASDQLIANHGDIVLTCSSSSYYAGGGGALYVSSKFAVRGLVTELAHEYAPAVRVNGVAPGGTITALSGVPALAGENLVLNELPGIAESIEGANPLGIAASPADHAWSYALLASRERTRAITGTIINSDGGLGSRNVAYEGLGKEAAPEAVGAP